MSENDCFLGGGGGGGTSENDCFLGGGGGGRGALVFTSESRAFAREDDLASVAEVESMAEEAD